MFITQQSNSDRNDSAIGIIENKQDSETFMGVDVMDFSTPCLSLVSSGTHYSDISDVDMDDDFQSTKRYIY